MSHNSIVLALACSSALVLSSAAFGQTEGACFVDPQQDGTPCVCLSEKQQQDFRLNDNAVLCDAEGALELSRLTPELQDLVDPLVPGTPVTPVTPPVEPVDPNQPVNNGIGNGVQDAPGSSDVTNGDVADGDQSETAGTSGTAANGDAAGAGNNGNSGNNGSNGNGG